MKNPWLKKNPMLSMWLSGANAIGGAARSRANAQIKRQAKTIAEQNMAQLLEFWAPKSGSAPKRKKKSR